MTPGSATCMGSATGGGYGACCDSDSQCASGMFCQQQYRFCTLPCSVDVDCPFSPLFGQQRCLSNTSTPAQCPSSQGSSRRTSLSDSDSDSSADRRLDAALSGSHPNFCDASTAFGWSFAAYCSVSATGNLNRTVCQ